VCQRPSQGSLCSLALFGACWQKTQNDAGSNGVATGTAPSDAASSAQPPATASSGDAELDAEIARLAGLAPILYERERQAVAERFAMRVSVLDKLVRAERNSGVAYEMQGQALKLFEPTPCRDSVDGATLLHELRQALLRFVVMSADDAIVTALWILHCYCFDLFICTPRLGILSPQKRCGKTTFLDVLDCSVPRGLLAANLTAAVVFRSVEKYRPTLLIDEADNLWRRGASDVNQDLLAVLNSGARHGGQVLRIAGDDFEPRAFSTHAPAALAAIGQLPETVMDRSIAVRLGRKRADQKTESLRHEKKEELRQLARKCQRFANDHRDPLGKRRPEMPAALTNRVADCWEPLLTIADECGPQWGETARNIAIKAATAPEQDENENVALLVLSDIRDLFLAKDTDRLSSMEIIRGLNEREERPWSEWRGAYGIYGITQAKVAQILKPFGIALEPNAMLLEFMGGKKEQRGYLRARFEDSWQRYLPPRPP